MNGHFPGPKARIWGTRLAKAGAAVLVIILIGGGTAARASTAHGFLINNMKQILLAMRAYEENMGSLPTDIHDKDGKPLLSWRVALLPFIEQDQLYLRFNLKEPWDSENNRRLITQICRTYSSPFSGSQGGKTPFVFSPFREGPIRLVEMDEANEVIWTKPADLKYDPDNPTTGLNLRWKGRGQLSGFFAGMADDTVRFVYKDADIENLRGLFEAADPALPDVTLPWHTILRDRPYRSAAWIALFFCVIAVVGAVLLCVRKLLGKPLSPGEWLWLIFGANQLVFALVFISFYQIKFLPLAHSKKDEDVYYWLLPRIAGALASLVALNVNWGQSSLGWRAFWLFSAFLWVYATLEALGVLQDMPREYSLFTGSAPFVMLVTGWTAAFLTLRSSQTNSIRGRWLAHWAGIALVLSPFFSLCFFAAFHNVEMPPAFHSLYRIRE
jgi:hypothetical protein